MSTRAIIALPAKDGYETAWCWNNGGPSNLGRELRRYFKSEELVRKLIGEHSFSTVLGPYGLADIMSKFQEDDDKIICLPNARFVLKHGCQGGVVAGKAPDGHFGSIEEMLQEDLNYIYVFENGKWKTYK